MRVLLPFLFTVLSLAPFLRAAPAPVDDELTTLTRDDAAAEAAILAGDVDAALRYFDYTGHEQEAFARASVEYRRARVALRRAVRQTFGGPAWAQAAADLGVVDDGDEPDPARRSVRRQGDVLYVKMRGARHEVPYVKADDLWKVSVRDVLLTAVRARFGADVAYEEADLFVLAGKMAKVMQGRAQDLSALADDVRGGRVRTRRELRDAVRRIRRAGTPAAAAPAPAAARP